MSACIYRQYDLQLYFGKWRPIVVCGLWWVCMQITHAAVWFICSK